MNGSSHSKRPSERDFFGRNEKRLPISVPVYLATLEEPRAHESTSTENVSSHGARVVSKRSWRPGEESLITPQMGELSQVGRVIYCLPSAGDRFCLGMEFLDRAADWGEHSSVWPSRVSRY